MNFNDFPDNPEDSNYIPGIYNYCDGWCERCAFQARCSNYARRQEMFGDAQPDMDSDEFWEQFTGTLQASLDLLREVVEEEGIEIDDLDLEAEMQLQAEEDELLASHPLTVASEAYIGIANDWFDGINGQPQPEVSDLDLLAALGPPVDKTLEEVIEAVEVIRWHQLFITVKIQRALSGEMRGKREPEFWESRSRDANGSAKIALIAIDRSVGAWGILLGAFPGRKVETFNLLSHLAQLRFDLEKAFPNAWAFVRPGFDEVN